MVSSDTTRPPSEQSTRPSDSAGGALTIDALALGGIDLFDRMERRDLGTKASYMAQFDARTGACKARHAATWCRG